MATKNPIMDRVRLQAWYDGVLPDDELTADEVDWLQQAVFDAVARKNNAAPPAQELQ